MRVVLLLLVWCLSVVTVAAQAPSPLATRIDELRERIDARAYDDAEALAAALREDAAQAGDDDTVALTMRLLGGMRIDQERLAEARTQLVAAQEFARSRGLRRRELEATLMLSRVGAIDGDAERAEVDAMAALDELVALDLPREATLWAFNQALASVRGMDGRRRAARPGKAVPPCRRSLRRRVQPLARRTAITTSTRPSTSRRTSRSRPRSPATKACRRAAATPAACS